MRVFSPSGICGIPHRHPIRTSAKFRGQQWAAGISCKDFVFEGSIPWVSTKFEGVFRPALSEVRWGTLADTTRGSEPSRIVMNPSLRAIDLKDRDTCGSVLKLIDSGRVV